MTKPRDAWMPLYVADYLADTGRLTTEGHGAYLLLLMDYWRSGPPPDDDETLAAITKLSPARWTKLKPVMSGFFTIAGGRWRQKRADEEMAKAGHITDIRSASGKAGAAKRWGKPGDKPGDKPDGDGGGKPGDKPDAPPMAGAMAKPSQNDAPSPREPSPAAAAAASDVPEAARDPLPSAEEHEKRLEIGAKVLVAARIDEARWMGNFALISAWLSAGFDPELDILPAVRSVAARPAYKPPRSLGYFTDAIETAWRTRMTDIPAATQRPAPAQRLSAYDRAVDRWLAMGRGTPEPRREDFEGAA